MIDFKTFVKEQEEHEEFLQEAKSQGIYVGTFGNRFVAFKLNGVSPEIKSQGQFYDIQKKGRDLEMSSDVKKDRVYTKGSKGYSNRVRQWIKDKAPDEFYINVEAPSHMYFADSIPVAYR